MEHRNTTSDEPKRSKGTPRRAFLKSAAAAGTAFMILPSGTFNTANAANNKNGSPNCEG